MKYLVLGGVRSGKSAFAQDLVAETGKPVCYVATSQVWDDEMAQRVERHKLNRPEQWQLIEEPIALAETLNRLNHVQQAVIVECFSLWLSNLLCLEDDQVFERERQSLLKAVEQFQGELVLVSSEVGLGIMPMNALARRFADEAGMLNQTLAKLTDRVTFVAAGLPMPLK
ncbi:bifunctional adenosylcobinamide kinase/adenosylcobinamide-phosphate guanylyltransferase [Marinomonas sp. TW1]|uniref:bifunctional adenosylcobinamide kinase/adenosylcobinamide-phosphate guanylyltransferase n=1 Tax=Marinomonas sp. TW1 TaxID=1561203 RepID=UPI0007AF0133|nr:bifunctional adenosylcobinamide kinase/adenosylcobinamide-phosphate guanylyltransferase [Marinomonas sp. TW1]KZN15052.1 adenosylcobinamide kinase [Marinomonas sp. TW1]